MSGTVIDYQPGRIDARFHHGGDFDYIVLRVRMSDAAVTTAPCDDEFRVGNVFDPFWDLVDWLDAIADDRLPASIKIDEEGVVTRLTVLPYRSDWVEFRADRPPGWVEASSGGWVREPEHAAERLILCRVRKYQLLAEFHRRLKDFIERDYPPRTWHASYWYDYEHGGEPYVRTTDLRRLDLRHLAAWLEANRPKTMKIAKIVSGGRTGADRVALDWAIENGIPHGGWCRAGRLAEDGTIPQRYQLDEMPDGGGYRRRTKANVRDTDATLVVSIEPVLTGGSKETVLFAQRLAKPWLHVHPQMDWRAALAAWLDSAVIETLNVAGPRASRELEITAFTWTVLDELHSVLGRLPGEPAGGLRKP